MFKLRHDIDVLENYIYYSACIIVVCFIVIGIQLFVRDEYTASSIFIMTAFLFIKDVLIRNIEETRKERKKLERNVDSMFRLHFREFYEIITCKDCIFRFSCKQAYKEEETNGHCSLNMYTK